MDFGDFGLREAIWLALLAAAGILAVSVFRLLRLRRPAEPLAVEPRTRPGMPELTFIAANGLVKPAEEPAAAPPSFADQLSATALAAEVKELRAEVAALRDELRAARAPRPVAPFYGEAVALAERGYDARGIAEECGISVAEAELLLAMSRRREGLEQGGDDDGIWRGRAVSGR